MFRALRRSSSGAPTVFAASGLCTRVVTARSQVWVGTESVMSYVVSPLWCHTNWWTVNQSFKETYCPMFQAADLGDVCSKFLMYQWYPSARLQCHMALVIRCQTLLEDLWTIWSCCLYVFYEYYYHIPSYSIGSIFYQCIYGFIPVQ